MSSLPARRAPSTVRLGNPQLQETFTRHILPRVETHARIFFRKHRDRDEMVAETVALAWKWFLRLAAKGKDATQFPAALATLAARAVKSGRRVTGQLKAKDAMNPQTQQRKGFCVGKLPDFSTLNDNPLQEALIDNTVTPPPEQAAFRIDFPGWLRTHSNRDRRVILDMAQGERTQALAARYEISPARISQLRREAHQSWEQCQA